MRNLALCSLLFLGWLLVPTPASAQANALADARAFYAQRQYDKSAAVLEKWIASGHADAETYNELGRAYHMMQDYEQALKSYRQAAKLDPKYTLSLLPIILHFKSYDEVIRLGEGELAKGDMDPIVLTSLLGAYHQQYLRVLDIVKAQRYSDAYDANYRLFILAKAEVYAGRYDSAIAYTAQINDRAILQFMRTFEDFKPIADDPRFKKLTE